jgi:hypothetical protein
MHREVPFKAVGLVGVLVGALAAWAQEPINDKLEVTLPHTTWVGSQSLAPGTYQIRQLPTASSPRLLEFSSENGTKMETAITTIAAIGNNTRHDTSVTLEQKNGQYHLTHVWIAGKTYGYELPVDQSRQQASTTKSETVTLAGNFTPNPPPAAPAPQEPTRAQAPEPPKQEPQQVAQAQPQPPPQPAPPPAPQAAATPEPTPQPENAQIAAQTPAMPSTATHWPDLLLGGIVLMLLGLIVRPRTSSAF